MTAWINHVREFAKTKGISYRTALKNPECSLSYKQKSNNKKSKKSTEEIAESTAEPNEPSAPKKKDRPRKYVSTEEAKEAKKEMTVKSNNKKKAKMVNENMEGKGIMIPNTNESTGGLEHIYPLSHDIVLKMLGIYINIFFAHPPLN